MKKSLFSLESIMMDRLSKEVPQGYRVTIRDEDSYSEDQFSIAHDTSFIQVKYYDFV